MGKGEGERGGGGGREDGEGKRYRQTKGKEIQGISRYELHDTNII